MCVAREQTELRIRQKRSIANSQNDVPDINLDE
jgi:hypothetical protein